MVFTKTVRTPPTTTTGNQNSWERSSFFLIRRYNFTQNAIAGAAIRNVVRNREATSGPNITLPPQKNFWKKSNKEELVKYNMLVIAARYPITST